jgi:Tfp pilus assembly protein FimV
VDNACYIGNIHGATVSAGTFLFVIVDASGKLGTATVDANGKVTVPGLPGANPPQAISQRVQPQAIGPDPKQAMLNRRVEELQATVAEQQKQIEALTAQIQKVSAQLEATKPAPQMVNNP